MLAWKANIHSWKRSENKRKAQDYLNDFQLSQQALQVMLKSGTITVPQREKSVYTCCPELYNSSSSEVVIELVPVRSGDDFRTVSCTDKDLINSGYELKDLSLDLRKCPNLTSIVGKKLGTKGAKLLSQYISFKRCIWNFEDIVSGAITPFIRASVSSWM